PECTPTDISLVAWCKAVPDDTRRAVVGDLRAQLLAAGVDTASVQLTTGQLREWVDAGMELANHTWDHPCLDRCPEPVQREQITTAHDAIADACGRPPAAFAYPNGNVTDVARECIRGLGYALGVDFAHRRCSRRSDRLVLPRLRVDTDAPIERFRAIAS